MAGDRLNNTLLMLMRVHDDSFTAWSLGPSLDMHWQSSSLNSDLWYQVRARCNAQVRG